MPKPLGTYALINSTTLGSAQSSVTFSSIPGTYTDLILVASGSGTADIDLSVRFNSDSGTNYSRTTLTGNGTSAASSRDSNANLARLNSVAYWNSTGRAVSIGFIMDYSNTTTNKTMLTRSNNAGVGVDTQANLWRSTSAITSIEVFTSANSFASGSTFKLYGVTAGNQ